MDHGNCGWRGYTPIFVPRLSLSVFICAAIYGAICDFLVINLRDLSLPWKSVKDMQGFRAVSPNQLFIHWVNHQVHRLKG